MIDKHSLLLDLRESDYDAVLEDVRNLSCRVKYYYAIDFYDLSEYCFPFGLREEDKSQKSVDYVADEQYTFYQLFERPTSDSQVILLDEYLEEVVLLKRFLKYAIENGIELVNALKEYEAQFNRYPELFLISEKNTHNLQSTLNGKLSLILSISVDILNEGIVKLMSLFKDHKIIFQPEDLVASTREDRVEKIAIDEAFSEFNGEDSNKDIIVDILHERKSKIRDATAISRIIAINKFLEQKYLRGELKNRCVILYLSSAESSRALFKHDIIKKMLPVINGNPFVFLRTVPQIFLHHICKTSPRPEETVENIHFLKKRLLEIKQFQDKIFNPSKEVRDLLFEKFSRYRQTFENDALLNRYDSFSKLLNNTLKHLDRNVAKDDFTKDLVPVINQIIKKGESSNAKAIKNLISLSDWTNQIATIVFADRITNRFLKNNAAIRIKTGDDSIRSVIHHLPIVFFSDSLTVTDIVRSLSKIIFDSNSAIKDELNQLIVDLFNKNYQIGSSLEGRLMKALMLLITPDDVLEGKNSNELAYNWTRDILYKDILSNSNLDKENAAAFSVIERDYRYFVAWAARRAKLYDNSFDMLTASQQKFANDPRFPHGLCLTTYCLYSAQPVDTPPHKLISLVEKCISNAQKAIELYKSDSFVIRKTELALLNSIGYLNLELHILHNRPDHDHYLKLSRDYIQTLKQNEPDYLIFPEYLHTESVLDYHETILELSRPGGQRRDALQSKLQNAIQLIDQAIYLLNNSLAAPNKMSIPKYEKHRQSLLTLLNDKDLERA